MNTSWDDSCDLSIVIPLYNEQAVFVALRQRLAKVMGALPLSTEAVLVDDGSTDATRELATMACQEDPRFRLVVLSRNFGHQLAISAGLRYACGRAVAILDGDLQDPPEALLDFHRKLNEGFDVVYAIRRRRTEVWTKRLAAWVFYRVLRALSAVDIPLDSGDFCMMTRRVAQQLNAMPERHRFLRGMRSWVGFRQVGVEYERGVRGAGRSKYTIRRLWRLACDGMVMFSDAPLRLATWMGIAVTIGSLAIASFLTLWQGSAAALLPAAAFFLGGVQLFCLGILGEYVGRIHAEVKGRPIFVVEQVLGFEPKNSVGPAPGNSSNKP
jgi:dolichol-phosphate mannosyltransferase